jgi:hypothetical protein
MSASEKLVDILLKGCSLVVGVPTKLMWANWTIQYGQSLTSRPDGQMMNILLRQFSQQLSDNVHAVLLWDPASFHKSKDLRKSQNITIMELACLQPGIESG